MPGLVIVGAGECGARAALSLREQGWDGSITLIGGEPHPPYERPPLSKQLLQDDFAQRFIADPRRYEDAGIELRLGSSVDRIERAAREIVLTDGTRLPYRTLLLATGAAPRPFPGRPPALYLRSWNDAQAIRARAESGATAILIGGGFISLELAAALRAKGLGVVVLEMAPNILGRALSPDISDVLAARHRAENVDLRTGVQISAIEDHRVILADGSTLSADIVAIGIGAVPNTALAQDAGLAIDNGIAVDASLRTSDPSIYAAGDCCSFPHFRSGARIRLECWRNAADQGAHVAAAMLGSDQAYTRVPWFWSDQYDLSVQVAGLPDALRPTIRRDIDADTFMLMQLDSDGALIHAAAVGSSPALGREMRLAEWLIEDGRALDPDRLADPAVKLKQMLRG